MNKVVVMISWRTFETVDDAYKHLQKYNMIDGTCETYLVNLPEKLADHLISLTKKVYP